MHSFVFSFLLFEVNAPQDRMFLEENISFRELLQPSCELMLQHTVWGLCSSLGEPPAETVTHPARPPAAPGQPGARSGPRQSRTRQSSRASKALGKEALEGLRGFIPLGAEPCGFVEKARRKWQRCRLRDGSPPNPSLLYA